MDSMLLLATKSSTARVDMCVQTQACHKGRAWGWGQTGNMLPSCLLMAPLSRLAITEASLCPGGMSQCPKEDSGSSAGPPHETAAPKRTYDMMEGRVSRAVSSASIEGVCWVEVLGG